MSIKISAEAVKRVSRSLGEDIEYTPVILASMVREGVDVALKRFPDHRGRIVREAAILRERNKLDIPDMDCVYVETSGFGWSITPPSGFENFQVVATDRDSKRTHLRVTFIAYDMATGWDTQNSQSKQKKPYDIERDPVLRMAVARNVATTASVYLERILRNRQGMTSYYRRHLKSICKNVFSIKHLIPSLSLNIRTAPHLQGDEASKLLLTATFSSTFELAMNGRGTGDMFEGVEVQHNSSYFEIAGGVSTILDAIKSAPKDAKAELEDIVETIKAETIQQKRRKSLQDRETPVVPPNGYDITILEEGEDPLTVEVIGPVRPAIIKESNITSESKKAEKWWEDNSSLISPSISEISSSVMAAYGYSISSKDIDTLIELASPVLHGIANKRMSQFEGFGVDAAVIGLAHMLKTNILSKLA